MELWTSERGEGLRLDTVVPGPTGLGYLVDVGGVPGGGFALLAQDAASNSASLHVLQPSTDDGPSCETPLGLAWRLRQCGWCRLAGGGSGARGQP